MPDPGNLVPLSRSWTTVVVVAGARQDKRGFDDEVP